MNIKDKIINLDWGDYHIHSLNFSDWLNTVDEIVKFAWEIWLKEIAITDHSQIWLDKFKNEWIYPISMRRHIKVYKNVLNSINVIFWVEADILNEDWDVCFDIQWIESDFNILSLHKSKYNWNFKKVTEAYVNAIRKHHKKINFIWHPCQSWVTSEYLDIEKLVKVCNEYNLPLEFNWKNFCAWKTDLEKLDYLLNNANNIYINSDAHNLYNIKTSKKEAIEYLKEKKYI
jgi:histidinol phosphatase-like PHP family hydrolase